MCVYSEPDKCKMINRNQLGYAVRRALTCAKSERRLICGLLSAVVYLEKSPDNVILCVLPETRPGDAATHIQTVLLQAFCYENYIPVIQVDRSKKFADYCGISSKNLKNCNCALVIRNASDAPSTPEEQDDMFYISKAEQILRDFYECTLQVFPRPVIELPI